MSARAPGLTLADESPHDDAGTEWWFIQGHWRDHTAARTRFMVSLFRESEARRTGPRRRGHWLLGSILGSGASGAASLSWVDRESLDLFEGAMRRIGTSNLGPALADAYAADIAVGGPPAPLRVVQQPPLFRTSGLDVSWDTFSLRQTSESLALRFCRPDGGRPCVLHLAPVLPRAEIGRIRRGGMAYACYPSLELHGSVDGRSVAGQAWFDHQWGDERWVIARSRERRLRGWTWFGMSLSTGARLLVMLQFDAERRTVFGRRAVLMNGNGRPRLSVVVRATPLRVWRSPTSGIAYPVAWRIDLPAFRAHLRVEPLVDDQEIPVLGPARAVWEGAATVAGTIEGATTSGEVRLELWGYGYPFNLVSSLRRAQDRMDRRLAEYLPQSIGRHRLREFTSSSERVREPRAYSAVVSGPIWDLMERRGKRWRPLFGKLLLDALGTSSRPFEKLISVVAELPHTGSLIIDDIEDASRLRRGLPCIHLQYGLDVAINAANTVYFLPFLLLRRHRLLSDTQRLALYGILSEQYVRSHFGQGLDIYWSRQLTPNRLATWMADSMGPKILQSYAWKTGGLVEGLAAASCVLAQADAATTRAVRRFARDFAVAFQVVDDVRGFNAASGLRKHPGEDLAGGKLTYVLLRALDRLPPAARRRLALILCSDDLRGHARSHAEGVGLVRQSGALQVCANEARAMFERGWATLSRRVPPSASRLLLRGLCSHLLADASVARGPEGSHAPTTHNPESRRRRKAARR